MQPQSANIDDEMEDITQEWIPTSTNLEARYNGPTEDSLTDEQKQIRQDILKTRPRTGLSGPFGPWLAVPDIAQPAQQLGQACRYHTSLSMRESELIILLTAAKTRSHAEFDIHASEALRAGLSLSVIRVIPRDNDFSVVQVRKRVLPLLNDNAREWAIVLFAAELLDSYSVSDETYELTKQAVNDKDSVLVEITSIVGYYTFVAYTLNVFRIPSSSS
jgi:4-carboxymuconolactone decarboxylase